MAEPFLAEIRIFGFNFPPTGWAFCNGQLLPLSQNVALFSLLGTQYGGDGRSNFALPNLQGSSPLGMGSGAGLTPRVIGEVGGEQAVTLVASELPAHDHTAACNAVMGDQYAPMGNLWAPDAAGNKEYSSTAGKQMSGGAIANSGSSQPHNNLQPLLVLNFCIALVGIFPARS